MRFRELFENAITSDINEEKKINGLSVISLTDFVHDDEVDEATDLNEFSPAQSNGGNGDYFKTLASAWYNGAFDTGSLQKGIKSKEDIERLLNRGIVAPDGVTRKYAIDYNSDFDGVVISSDDYYEHADHDETDSRTGKPFGPYDYMEFGDEELSEGLNEFAPDGFNGGGDDEGFSPDIAKMAQEDGFTKGVSLVDGATLERAMSINHWHSQHGGMYKQYFAKGFKQGRMNKIRHDNKQYNLNLKLMKDGSIRHGEQGVAEGSSGDELNARPGAWRGDAKRMTSKGKPTQDELGMQDNLKNRIKSSNKKGGLTGPKGVLPEEQGVAEGSLNEGLAHPVIVVDVQPEYSGMNDGDESSVFPQIINFVNKQTGPVLMFVNAEDQGLSGDTIQDIKQYWDDTICPEEERYTHDEETDDYIENTNCPQINWQRFAIVDKGYGYLRSWMDHGIEPATIIATIRELYQQKKSDSRKLQFPAFNRRTPQQALIMGAMQEMEDDPISVNWTSVAQLKRFNGAYIVGGARDSCLREVELLMNAFNIKYKRIDSLIYEGQQGLAEAPGDFGLGANYRSIPDDEMQDFMDRSKTKKKTKRDKFDYPYVHGSNIEVKNEAGKKYNTEALKSAIMQRPKSILGQNAKMQHSETGTEAVYDIGLPALKGLAVNENTGEFVVVDTCPGAGACKTYCYAMKGSYVMFKAVSLGLSRMLNFLLNDPEGFAAKLNDEIAEAKLKNAKKGAKTVVRWHDAGDFFSEQYLDMAYAVANANPGVSFYAYTKMGDVANASRPKNFNMNFSQGASSEQEKKVDIVRTKHSKVVPKDMFFDLIDRDGNNLNKDSKGRMQFASPEKRKEFKIRLAHKYAIDPTTILTYDEMMQLPVGSKPKWNVIVMPGDGDNSANRNDVVGSYLLFH